VYQAVRDVILRHPAYPTLAKQGSDSPFWAVVMGFEHERIHIETSSVLFRELPASVRKHSPPLGMGSRERSRFYTGFRTTSDTTLADIVPCCASCLFMTI
jgi:hypothetical protein